ncbi:MAG: hypothetical protein AMXMBFR33_06720 [Candidatus Xenobia bacterium]
MLRWSDWLGQSEREFAAADCLLAGGHYAWCCFTCQQAAEKSLKALLERHAADHGGHNLRELLGSVETRYQPPGQVRAACRRLTRHYIPTRYPDAHPSGIPAMQYDQEDAQEALEDARAVLDFARAQLRPPAP